MNTINNTHALRFTSMALVAVACIGFLFTNDVDWVFPMLIGTLAFFISITTK